MNKPILEKDNLGEKRERKRERKIKRKEKT
jgi:hypothetical protein